MLLTDPAALAVLTPWSNGLERCRCKRVLATARHLQSTVFGVDWLQSGGTLPAQLGNPSWPAQGHSDTLSIQVLPQPDICRT